MDFKIKLVPQWYVDLCKQVSVPVEKYLCKENDSKILSKADLHGLDVISTSSLLYILPHLSYFKLTTIPELSALPISAAAKEALFSNGRAITVPTTNQFYPSYIDCNNGTILVVLSESTDLTPKESILDYMKLAAKYVPAEEVIQQPMFALYAHS